MEYMDWNQAMEKMIVALPKGKLTDMVIVKMTVKDYVLFQKMKSANSLKTGLKTKQKKASH